jgi:flavin reductase (DIM6/NTAB) family NADH-FMN oxidoreductase RutF
MDGMQTTQHVRTCQGFPHLLILGKVVHLEVDDETYIPENGS